MSFALWLRVMIIEIVKQLFEIFYKLISSVVVDTLVHTFVKAGFKGFSIDT